MVRYCDLISKDMSRRIWVGNMMLIRPRRGNCYGDDYGEAEWVPRMNGAAAVAVAVVLSAQADRCC